MLNAYSDEFKNIVWLLNDANSSITLDDDILIEQKGESLHVTYPTEKGSSTDVYDNPIELGDSVIRMVVNSRISMVTDDIIEEIEECMTEEAEEEVKEKVEKKPAPKVKKDSTLKNRLK